MIALDLKVNTASLWSSICYDKFNKLDEDLKATYLDIILGTYGIKAQHAALQAKRTDVHSYLKKYAYSVQKRQKQANDGFVLNIIEDNQNGDTVPQTISENVLGYLDTDFDIYMNSEAVGTLIKEFQRARTQILCAEHIDIKVLCYNVGHALHNETASAEEEKSVSMLKGLCKKYNLIEMMSELFRCRGVYDTLMIV